MTTSQPIHDDLQGFDLGARRAVVAAHEEARAGGHDRVGTEHLLLALLADEELAPVLRDAGAVLAAVRRKVAEAVPAAGVPSPRGTPLPRSARCARAIGRASRFARAARSELVSPDHLLLGVLDVEGTAGQVLRGLGVDIERLRTTVGATPSPASTDEEPAEDLTPPPPPPACPHCGAPFTEGVSAHEVPITGTEETATLLTCPTCGTVIGTR